MIKVQNLCFKYPGKELFFSNLHFELPPGHIYGLLGKNGAGKTTLLKLLTGLRFPQNGSVNVNGFQPRYRQSDFYNKYISFQKNFIYQITHDKNMKTHTLHFTRCSNMMSFYTTYINLKFQNPVM